MLLPFGSTGVMFMNRRLLFATTLLLSGFSLTGCELYDPRLVDLGETPDCGVPGAVPCKPDADTSSPDDMMMADFVLTDVTLNQTVGAIWRDIGLNLDAFDTQAPDFIGDCTPVSPSPDGNNGVDNQFGGTLWGIIQARLPTLECEINAAHSNGHGSLIISLTEWNGTANDADVTISILPALDMTSDSIVAADCNSVTMSGDGDMGIIEMHDLYNGDPGTLRPPPNMDGNDYACTNPNGRTNGNPTDLVDVRDTNAYVKDGVMVFSLTAGSDFVLYADRSSVQIRLNQGYMIMPMSEDFLTITDGFAAGRFPLTSLSKVGPEIGICDPAVLADSYEAFVDVLSSFDPDADGTNDCDALSVGVAFDAVRTTVAGSAPTAVEPFFLCTGMGGPTSVEKIEWPVQECCSSFSDIGDAMDCNAYYP